MLIPIDEVVSLDFNRENFIGVLHINIELEWIEDIWEF